MRPPLLDIIGYPSRTISIECSDNPQEIPNNQLTYNGMPVAQMLISCEINYVRFTMGDATPNIVNAVGHIMDPYYEFIFIKNSKAISTFQFCNGIAGQQQNSILHVTLFFERMEG